jgi:hypothetical protein
MEPTNNSTIAQANAIALQAKQHKQNMKLQYTMLETVNNPSVGEGMGNAATHGRSNTVRMLKNAGANVQR